MFVATGFPPAQIERFMEGTDKGELPSFTRSHSVKLHFIMFFRPLSPFPKALFFSSAKLTTTRFSEAYSQKFKLALLPKGNFLKLPMDPITISILIIFSPL